MKPNEPVVCVSYNDARAYVKWLNSRHGSAYRLPTEAQWEYVARGNTSTARFWGDDPNLACAYANVADQTKGPEGQTWPDRHQCNDGYWFVSPAATYQPNPFGLYDMLGNVWVWTQDCANDSYDGAPIDGSSWDSGHCTRRMIRGGSWSFGPELVRAAVRRDHTLAYRSNLVGFRLAKVAP